eukprot:1192468-Prorocentrum_minimum.AAC.3
MKGSHWPGECKRERKFINHVSYIWEFKTHTPVSSALNAVPIYRFCRLICQMANQSNHHGPMVNGGKKKFPFWIILKQ